MWNLFNIFKCHLCGTNTKGVSPGKISFGSEEHDICTTCAQILEAVDKTKKKKIRKNRNDQSL